MKVITSDYMVNIHSAIPTALQNTTMNSVSDSDQHGHFLRVPLKGERPTNWDPTRTMEIST